MPTSSTRRRSRQADVTGDPRAGRPQRRHPRHVHRPTKSPDNTLIGQERGPRRLPRPGRRGRPAPVRRRDRGGRRPADLRTVEAPERPRADSAFGDGGSGGGARAPSRPWSASRPPTSTWSSWTGRRFHLAENKGKVVVLDFWATWCGPCIQAMPQVEKATSEFHEKDVQLVAVNLQETPQQIKAMLERHQLKIARVALDKDGAIAEKYQAHAIPQTVIIGRDGNVSRLFVGGGPHLGDQLRDAIKATLDGEKPKESGREMRRSPRHRSDRILREGEPPAEPDRMSGSPGGSPSREARPSGLPIRRDRESRSHSTAQERSSPCSPSERLRRLHRIGLALVVPGACLLGIAGGLFAGDDGRSPAVRGEELFAASGGLGMCGAAAATGSGRSITTRPASPATTWAPPEGAGPDSKNVDILTAVKSDNRAANVVGRAAARPTADRAAHCGGRWPQPGRAREGPCRFRRRAKRGAAPVRHRPGLRALSHCNCWECPPTISRPGSSCRRSSLGLPSR